MKVYRILPYDLPRIPYISTKIDANIHAGQLKLLLTEIEFLTLYLNEVHKPDGKPIYFIYVGAAPGEHTPILSHMFPDVFFELYDARDVFEPELYKIPNIKCHIGFFTNDDAQLWRSELHKDKHLLFCCDIRSLDPDNEMEKSEKKVFNDQEAQKEWYRIIQPEYTMFKFRLPWTPGLTPYPQGDIYIQPFPRNRSTETRLISIRNAPDVLYNNKEYEEQLSFHNTEMRQRQYENPLQNIQPEQKNGWTNNYDSCSEIKIIEEYLKMIGMEAPQNIITYKRHINRILANKRSGSRVARTKATKVERLAIEL